MREESVWDVAYQQEEPVSELAIARQEIINQGLRIKFLEGTLSLFMDETIRLDQEAKKWRSWCYACACVALVLATALMLVAAG